MHRPVAAAALLALAACSAQTTTDAPPLQPGYTDPAFAARVDGTREVTLVTRVGSGADATAVSGATCTLGSAEISYPPITTPARIALPEVTGKPAPLMLHCSRDTLQATVELKPVVNSRGPLVPLPVGLVVAGVKYAAAASQDRWVHYIRRGDLEVTLGP